MGESGSAYARFRRAIERRQATAALSAAAELRHVALTDALELLLLLRERDRDRYPRAALRWHGRLCRDVPGRSLADAAAVLALLGSIGEDVDRGAASALAELLRALDLDQPARILAAWAKGFVTG
jgi:hypothetical protein